MTQPEALGLTLLFELPVMFILARGLPAGRLVLVAAGASCLTHPIAWRIASVLLPHEYTLGAILIETGVVLVEGAWYRFWLRAGLARSMLWSLLANATSFAAGVTIVGIRS